MKSEIGWQPPGFVNSRHRFSLKTSWRYPTALELVLIGIVFLGSPSRAALVDFNGIPNGTLVSTGNPYGGALDLQGQVTVFVSTPPDIITPISTEAIITDQAPFKLSGDSVVEALPEFVLGAFDYSSHVTATFLQPVVNVTFDAYADRTAGYTYRGTNGVDVFNGTGIIVGNQDSSDTVRWQQISLDLPAGYYLTQFDLTNHDPKPISGAVWLDNVAFTIAVPEPTLPVLLGVGLVGLLLVQRHDASRSA